MIDSEPGDLCDDSSKLPAIVVWTETDERAARVLVTSTLWSRLVWSPADHRGESSAGLVWRYHRFPEDMLLLRPKIRELTGAQKGSQSPAGQSGSEPPRVTRIWRKIAAVFC